MMDLPTYFIGTYAKNLLADWPVMTRLIQEQTTWVKDIINTTMDDHPFKSLLLTDQQLNDAFNGPLRQFFMSHLRAYIDIAKIETAMTMSKEDFFKEAEQPPENPLGFSPDKLSRWDFSVLKELHNKLVALTESHYTQWATQVDTWTETLVDDLKQESILLTDMELQDFKVNQPLSEIDNRFTELKVIMPKLSKSDFDFQQYYTLKLTLAVHSSLSRSQLPNSADNIGKILSELQKTLKAIRKAEKETAKTQEKALNELMMPILS